MVKMVFLGWFLISVGEKDGDEYNYLLEDRVHNVHVSLTVKEPLEYPVGSWGKFKINAECDQVKTSSIYGNSEMLVDSKFCNADNHEVMPCTNGMIVGGVMYC